ncbi:MAG: UDP-N-acetylmuramate dehydrogenase [Clostridia bacterium]|nr:UDP-N-acetylmuramate dehydrogenase [Clostridia bacterium]
MNYDRYLRDIRTCGDRVILREQEPLSHHTTFHIGGPVDLFLEPKDEETLRFLLKRAKEEGVRTLVIGRGSNLLFADAGFRGAVICTSGMRTIQIEGDRMTAGAGCTLASCANAAQSASLAGMEFAHGIPGSVGGAVFMNAGAYDGEIAGILVRSRYYDREKDEFGELDGVSHCFGYRESVYRSHPEWVILSADFQLSPGNSGEIRGKMYDLMARRIEKQPLEYPSAGSTFKRYPGRYTAQMIDEAGLKGYSVGGAQVSEKHAGFVINRGGATAEDVLALIGHIRKTIFDKFGIHIETEVIFVPESEEKTETETAHE